ncbi:Serine/threonine-protein kinase H1 [Beauveria bassiana]|nr:Serine/threonine-protein kinase H1 [Beauveria bassiana]
MDQPHRLFSLRPINSAAFQVLYHPSNADLVSEFMLEDALDIGHFESNATLKNACCIATLSPDPNADIVVPGDGTTVSNLQYEFLILDDTRIEFVDKSSLVSCPVRGGENGDENFLLTYSNDQLCKIEFKIDQSNWAEFDIIWRLRFGTSLPSALEARRNAVLPPRRRATADTQVFPATNPKPERQQLPRGAANTRATGVARFEYHPCPLGHGTFGTVHRVKDLKRNMVYAVKVQRKSNLVEREIEILKSLKGDNTNIVQYHGHLIYQETGLVHIFMDIMKGSLHDMVAQKRCPVQLDEDGLARKMYHHVLQGLDHIHSKGFIHRDLKPANILWTLREGELSFCIADFGVSVEQSLAKSAVGTPEFFAPEYKFHCPQTTAIDLWSLFITYLWTTNLENFRNQNLKGYDDLLLWIASLARRRWNDLAAVQELIVLDPKDRATASQMLKHKFKGDGLKTKDRNVPDLPTVMAPEIKNPRTGVKWLHQLVRPSGMPAQEPIHEMAPGNHVFTRLVLWSLNKENNVQVFDQHKQSGGGGRITVVLIGKAFKDCPKSPVTGRPRVTKQKAAAVKRLVIREAIVRGASCQAKAQPAAAAGALIGRTPGLLQS